MKPWNTVTLLSEDLTTSNFVGGDAAMDDWFRNSAQRLQQEGRIGVHCCIDEWNKIHGFFALTHSNVESGSLSSKMRGKKQGTLPALLLARLGLLQEHRGQGLGAELLLEAFSVIANLNRQAPVGLIFLDAKNDKLVEFYKQMSFQSSPNDKYRMYMKTASITQILETAASPSLS